MKTITTLPDYCREINIPAPRHPFFDIRRFEDNMATVNARQPPFRHEFYAVALRLAGQNTEVNGQPLASNLFFNSPYQVITWDIRPDWQGWYILFGREFLGFNPAWANFIIDFPFFRLDRATPLDLPAPEAAHAELLFQKIADEYHSARADKFLFIQAYTQLLLLTTKRFFDQAGPTAAGPEDNRTADILLVSRFQSLVETLVTNEKAGPASRQPSYYAEQLNVHPNHLNAVVKRITGKTASGLVQAQLVAVAQSLLRQTDLTAKEIGYRLHFAEPTHFNAFFKKMTGLTPQQFREK
jgi:AraC-like DNA-binding protein